MYGEGSASDRDYILIDTGGLSGDEAGIDKAMAEQSIYAIEEADIVLFIVDGREGLNQADEMIADLLRRRSKQSYVVVNKTDGVDPDIARAEFYGLGLGDPLAIAASHGRGVSQLIDYVLDEAGIPVPEEDEEEESDFHRDIRIAIIGRPNVGKSTLVNRMLGEDRVVVFDHAGTTRDSIYIPYERDGQLETLLDTAGVRRRRQVTEAVEKFSIIKALQAIKDANVVICVIDARDGVTDQDLTLLGFVIESGRSLVIALNKWDGMAADDRESVKTQVKRRLEFADFARFNFISAKHGTGVGDLYRSVNEAYEFAMKKWSTNSLTKLLEDVVADHQPPMINNRRIKLRYAHQGGSNPPIIVVHGSQTESLPGSYKRYLENRFIKYLKVRGTPIRFEFKTGKNPFAGRVNTLSARQLAKKERNRHHIKDLKKRAKNKKRDS